MSAASTLVEFENEHSLDEVDVAETRRRFAMPVPAGLTRFHLEAAREPARFPGAYPLPVVVIDCWLADSHWLPGYKDIAWNDEAPPPEWFATGERHEQTGALPAHPTWRRRLVVQRWYVDFSSLDALLAALTAVREESDGGIIISPQNDGSEWNADAHAEYGIMLYNGYIE